MRRLLRRAKNAVYEFDARRAARQARASLEAEADRIIRQLQADGSQPEPGSFRKAEEYAREVLGASDYAPWLKVYAAAAGGFRDGWIPDNYYGRIVIRRIDGRYRSAADAKTFINRVLHSPNVPDVAYVVRGLFYDRDFRLLAAGQLRDVLFADARKVIFKPEITARGRSFEEITAETLDAEKFRRARHGVFQRYVQQHPFFDEMTTGSATTLRLTTAIDNLGAVGVRAGYLRIARQGDRNVRSESALRVAVDLPAGRLANAGYMPDWAKVERHPDSGFAFSGQEMPAIRDATSLVVGLHGSFPQLSCIGWDICIDADGVPQILEWNTSHNDIKFSEAMTGPCFADLGWERLWQEPEPRRSGGY
ncbi:MAG: hypothetical protein KIS68_07525 [Bauldia sp.]|nr:hypothetical protein [Bauldia sp.]